MKMAGGAPEMMQAESWKYRAALALVARMQRAGRGAQNSNERPWVCCSSVEQTAVRRQTPCRDVTLTCGRIVGDSHKAPSAVAQGM
jgi:hypothetical protein